MYVEDLPVLSDWLYVEVWTLEEAAMLWAAIDPISHDGKRLVELKKYVSEVQYKKSLIYLRAAQEAVCAGTLPFTEAWEEHHDESGNCWVTEVDFPKLPRPLYISTERTRIQQAAFRKWAESKKMPSFRQTLIQANRITPPSLAPAEIVEFVESARQEEQAPVFLLEGPSPLDQTHPCHSEELKLGMDAWTIAVSIGAPKKGKSVKETILEILETYPQFAHLTGEARNRISVTVNWNKRGGATKTPESPSLPTPLN